MKIGDEVYVHGCVDEIRKDVVIIRNEGGYFGTIKEEINLQPTCNLASNLISRQALCEYALNQKDKSVTPNDIMRFPSAQPEPCEDTISRKAAIDALKKQMSDWNDDYNVPVRKSIENIERLPSAQPEIVRCKDCKWFHDIGCAIQIVDDSDKPSENDYCSFAERRNDERSD